MIFINFKVRLFSEIQWNPRQTRNLPAPNSLPCKCKTSAKSPIVIKVFDGNLTLLIAALGCLMSSCIVGMFVDLIRPPNKEKQLLEIRREQKHTTPSEHNIGAKREKMAELERIDSSETMTRGEEKELPTSYSIWSPFGSEGLCTAIPTEIMKLCEAGIAAITCLSLSVILDVWDILRKLRKIYKVKKENKARMPLETEKEPANSRTTKETELKTKSFETEKEFLSEHTFVEDLPQQKRRLSENEQTHTTPSDHNVRAKREKKAEPELREKERIDEMERIGSSETLRSREEIDLPTSYSTWSPLGSEASSTAITTEKMKVMGEPFIITASCLAALQLVCMVVRCIVNHCYDEAIEEQGVVENEIKEEKEGGKKLKLPHIFRKNV